jgi:DCN1-like protein 1/2
MFCLAYDCGSKVVGEFERAGFISGWAAMPGECVHECPMRCYADVGSIDSIDKMKGALPYLRRKLNSDPVYFKKVYMHTFELSKASGARVIDMDTGMSSFPHITTDISTDGS